MTVTANKLIIKSFLPDGTQLDESVIENKKKTPFLEGVFFCLFFSNQRLQKSMSKIDLQYNK